MAILDEAEINDFPSRGKMRPDEFYQKRALGSAIGIGGAREVFDVVGHPHLVIKRVHLPSSGPNFVEWILWNALRETKLAPFFGECFEISHTGRFLVMEKLEDVSELDRPQFPMTPDWLRDTMSARSLGKSCDGRVKFRDYASCNISNALVEVPLANHDFHFVERTKK